MANDNIPKQAQSTVTNSGTVTINVNESLNVELIEGEDVNDTSHSPRSGEGFKSNLYQRISEKLIQVGILRSSIDEIFNKGITLDDIAEAEGMADRMKIKPNKRPVFLFRTLMSEKAFQSKPVQTQELAPAGPPKPKARDAGPPTEADRQNWANLMAELRREILGATCCGKHCPDTWSWNNIFSHLRLTGRNGSRVYVSHPHQFLTNDDPDQTKIRTIPHLQEGWGAYFSKRMRADVTFWRPAVSQESEVAA